MRLMASISVFFFTIYKNISPAKKNILQELIRATLEIDPLADSVGHFRIPLKKNTHSMERRRIEKYRVERIKTERYKKSAIPYMVSLLNGN